MLRRLAVVQLLADPFALTQAFTGEDPVYSLGDRPAWPMHLDLPDELWDLMERCWDDDPNLRPEMSEVSDILRDSLVSILSKKIGTHLPGIYEVDSPPRTNTLGSPNPFYRVKTRS